jgi:molybdopterin converting factor small subunit
MDDGIVRVPINQIIMNILLFGQLADAAGAKTLQVDAPGDTDELILLPPYSGG